MILVRNTCEIWSFGAFLPMNYLSDNYIWYEDSLWPKNTNPKIDRQSPARCRCHFSPALTLITPILIASMPVISPWPSEWVKTRPSADYTAKPAEPDSANEKAHSCSTPSCQSRTWCELSNVWAMAALSRPPQAERPCRRDKIIGPEQAK